MFNFTSICLHCNLGMYWTEVNCLEVRGAKGNTYVLLTGPSNRHPDTGWRDYKAQATDQWPVCETYRVATWQNRFVTFQTVSLSMEHRIAKRSKDTALVRLLLMLKKLIHGNELLDVIKAKNIKSRISVSFER